MWWTCSSARRSRSISDTTGYGTASVNAYVPMLKGIGAEVVYQGNVDAANPDLKPELLRMQSAGAEAIMPWSVNAGFLSRIINTRGQMGWDVPIVGQTTLGSGQTKALLEKPEYWAKVYPNNFRPVCYAPGGKLTDRTNAFVDRLKSAKIDMSDTLLWWIALGYDSPRMIAEAMKSVGTEPEAIVGYLNKLKDFPGVYGDISLYRRQARRLPGQRSGDGRGQFAQGRRVQSGSRLRRLSRWSQSIVSTGLAIGCIYALIAITYNVMFSASRVFSFTAGTLGMLGGVLGSLFIARMGMPVAVGFLLALAGGAVLGIVTEIVAVRPVLKSLDQHLYVLSTLALALMVQQFTAIEWSTEPQPFPRLFDIARGGFDQQFWLPMLACAAVIVGLELLYRHTLIGHAFLAIAEDNFAARALGLPERSLAHGELCARRRHRRARGLCRRRDAAGLLRQCADADLLWFRPGRAGRHGQQPRRRRRRPPARIVSADRQLPGRRHLRLGGGLHGLHHRPAGAPRGPRRRNPATTRLMDTQATPVAPGPRRRLRGSRARSARRCRSWRCSSSASRSRCSAAAIGA